MADDTPTTETPDAPDAAPATEKQTVPYERFAQKVAEIKALETKLAEAAQSSDVAAAWETKHNELNATFESERAAWNQKSALYQVGINDPDVSELARWRFEKSGSEDFGQWLETDAKNDPILKTHLTKPEAAPTAAPTPEATPAPSPNTGARSAPPPRGEFSPEAVQNMSIEEIKANYGKIAGAWGYTPRKFN